MKAFLIILLLFATVISFGGDSKPQKITITFTYTTKTLEDAAILIAQISNGHSNVPEVTITLLNNDKTTTVLKQLKSKK